MAAIQCHYCGSTADTDDHIIPRALKGSSERWNIVPACRSCNCSKHASFPTCPCETCVAAVWRHLADPATRTFIVDKLARLRLAAERSAARNTAQARRSQARADGLGATLARMHGVCLPSLAEEC